MAKEKKKKGSIVINIFIILLFIVGAGIFTYPTISNYWNEYRNAQLVTKYNESVSDLSDDQYEKLWQEAEEYNAEHKVNTIVDAFNEEDYVLSHPYDEVLDPNGDADGKYRDSQAESDTCYLPWPQYRGSGKGCRAC